MRLVAVVAVGWWGILRLDRQEKVSHARIMELFGKETQSVMDKAFLETELNVQFKNLPLEQEAAQAQNQKNLRRDRRIQTRPRSHNAEAGPGSPHDLRRLPLPGGDDRLHGPD